MAFFFLSKSFLRQASKEVLWLSSFLGRAVRQGQGTAGQGRPGLSARQGRAAGGRVGGGRGATGGQEAEHPKLPMAKSALGPAWSPLGP